MNYLRGWSIFCPIYAKIDENDNLIDMVPRHSIFFPLFFVTEVMWWVYNTVTGSEHIGLIITENPEEM